MRALHEANVVGVSIGSLDGRVLWANDYALRLMGASPDDLAAERVRWADLTAPEFRDRDARAVQQLRSERRFLPFEKQYERADGSRVWILVAGALLAGTDDRFISFLVDVSERRSAEEALRRSERILDAIIESSNAPIYVKDAEGRFLLANSAAARFLGATKHAVVGRTDREFLAAETAEAFRRDDLEVMNSGALHQFEESVVREDGVHTFLSSKFPVRDLSGTVWGIGGLSTDVTPLKRSEAALRENELRFRTLADNIPQLAWMADETGWIFWFNRRWLEYTGGTPEEMEGWGWRKIQHPDFVDRVVAGFLECIRSGSVWEDTFPMRGRDGGYRWFLSRAIPVRDAAGRVFRWLGTNTDVTEQRDVEDALRQRERELVEADRRKDEFLALLSHELRNPLAPVRNALLLLERTARLDARERQLLAVAHRQTDHLTRLIDDLLDVTRISRGKIRLQVETFDLGELVRRTGEDLRVLFERNRVAFSIDVPEEPVWVRGDAARIAQVTGNLLHNAAKFTHRSGRVALALERLGETARISVADNGVGFEPALREAIFEPFTQADRSLDRSRGGLGLGLALARSIVELHGGGLSAESPGPGSGATFRVTLPLSPAPAGAEPAPAGTGHEAVRPLRIVVVEDNRDAADTLRDVLELEGHSVSVAYSGPHGLRLAREVKPDVLLCDIGLPEMDGYELARTIRSDPGLDRVHLVALSGYALPDDQRRAAEAGFERHLAKPADLGKLEAVLESIARAA